MADFEASPEFESKITKFVDLIDSIRKEEDKHEELHKLIGEIGYHLLPKKVEAENEDVMKNQTQFLTNDNPSKEYFIKGTNYFIDAPIELHLICVLWVMKVGRLIDAELSESCFWFRLNEKIKRPEDKSSHIFKIYHIQYSEWRNKALETAENLLKNDKKDIAILSLDLKHCFYCINTKFSTLNDLVQNNIEDEKERKLALELNKILNLIHEGYREKIGSHFDYSHPHVASLDNHYSLPIGLVSSGLLCNWFLNDFDHQITSELNPAYYGRYIDDILVVISNPEINSKDTIKEFMKKYFEKNEILKFDEHKGIYGLNKFPGLTVQSDKIYLHYYNANQSTAILDIFKQKITENSSAFYLLPIEDLEFHINETAYNLLFSGSTNKFRNITKLVENTTELSINLTKIISTLNQSKADEKDIESISDQILKFYQGKNFINFCRTWEKLFTFTIVTRQYDKGSNFYNDVKTFVQQITKFFAEVANGENTASSDDFLEKQKSDLYEYLDISLSLPVGLLGSDRKSFFTRHNIKSKERFKDDKSISEESNNISKYSEIFRESNLIRHNYIAYPLLNYTNYSGSLLEWDQIEKEFQNSSLELQSNKVKYSPRFIHYDEFFLHSFARKLEDISKLRCNEILSEYLENFPIFDKLFPIDIKFNKYFTGTDSPTEDIFGHYYCVPKTISMVEDFENPDKLKIGLANIKIAQEDLEASYKPGRNPNLSFKRQKDLFKLLNIAKQEKCSLFILPELSIPYRWLPFMVNYSRNHQMGLIFGMEYWIVRNESKIAYNFVVTALPIRNEDKYKTCCVSIRCKNHYSPLEKIELKRAFLNIPQIKPFCYDLFKWRGSQFSVYNCYELADITHRSIFRSELDFLVACVLNRDLNYFTPIIESIVKDLHCFVIQVNCSDYGDSRIIQPTKKEQMDILRVSGGSNSTLLTGDLEIKKLREFQNLDFSPNDKAYKPTPPGFDNKKVEVRGKCKENN